MRLKTHFKYSLLIGIGCLLCSLELNAVNLVELDLPPARTVSNVNRGPVTYQVPPPGEFRDVDLPDEVKNNKVAALAALEDKTSNQEPLAANHFSIQVGVFKILGNAKSLEKKLLAQHFRVYIVEKRNKVNSPRYHIRIGQYKSRQQAEAVLNDFNQRSGRQAFIVSE